MNCINGKKLSGYLDGELPDDERARIRAHLAECARCRREADELTAISDALDVLDGLGPDPHFAARAKRFAAAAKPSRPLSRSLVPATAVLAGAIALFVGGFLGHGLYAGWAGGRAEAEADFAEYMGTTAIEDFPDGSLGEALTEIQSEGGNS